MADGKNKRKFDDADNKTELIDPFDLSQRRFKRLKSAMIAVELETHRLDWTTNKRAIEHHYAIFNDDMFRRHQICMINEERFRATVLVALPNWRREEGLEVLKRCKKEGVCRAERESRWCEFYNFQRDHPHRRFIKVATPTFSLPNTGDVVDVGTTNDDDDDGDEDAEHERNKRKVDAMFEAMPKAPLPTNFAAYKKDEREDEKWRMGMQAKGAVIHALPEPAIPAAGAAGSSAAHASA